MKPVLSLRFFAAVAACAGLSPSPSPVWHDEFDGPAGASFDRAKWVADTGGNGFGNQEREFYTTRAENVALDGDGHLVITARAEPPSSAYQCWYGRCLYTSTRLKTKGCSRRRTVASRHASASRADRDSGPPSGCSATDIDSVGWPQSGEIDIMENIGREPAVAHGTLHGPGYSGAGGIGRADTLSSGAYADDFHVFAVEWQPNEIRWYVDGRQYHRMTPADLPSGTKWVYDHPFFLLLNVAVGGGWPGDPDASTTFPQQMVVDYVRAYRDP